MTCTHESSDPFWEEGSIIESWRDSTREEVCVLVGLVSLLQLSGKISLTFTYVHVRERTLPLPDINDIRNTDGTRRVLSVVALDVHLLMSLATNVLCKTGHATLRRQ